MHKDGIEESQVGKTPSDSAGDITTASYKLLTFFRVGRTLMNVCCLQKVLLYSKTQLQYMCGSRKH